MKILNKPIRIFTATATATAAALTLSTTNSPKVMGSTATNSNNYSVITNNEGTKATGLSGEVKVNGSLLRDSQRACIDGNVVEREGTNFSTDAISIRLKSSNNTHSITLPSNSNPSPECTRLMNPKINIRVVDGKSSIIGNPSIELPSRVYFNDNELRNNEKTCIDGHLVDMNRKERQVRLDTPSAYFYYPTSENPALNIYANPNPHPSDECKRLMNNNLNPNPLNRLRNLLPRW